jgi:hypothetical protein
MTEHRRLVYSGAKVNIAVRAKLNSYKILKGNVTDVRIPGTAVPEIKAGT